MYIDLKGCNFTWSNGREGDARVLEKLDRVLANWEWMALFPNALAEAIPPIGSDNNPIILTPTPTPTPQPPKLARRFKFEAFWLDEAECEMLIENSWKLEVPGSYMYQLHAKIKTSRSLLWEWSKTKFVTPTRILRSS